MHELTELLSEYDIARAYTDDLWRDLTPDEVTWRPHEDSSAIGWHLGHQAHVAHFMIRNLTAAEPSPDPEPDALMDSANPEKFRGALPTVERLTAFRTTVAERVHARLGAIAAGNAAAPTQMAIVATHLLTALINHEYRHDDGVSPARTKLRAWGRISEVRAESLGHALPDDPTSDRLRRIDGYLVLSPYA
ncbi:MAG: DinB family protein [Streptomycetaceae bacterium]|nr:DinB family protein [Streptomycetaceae bacterium]